MAFAKQLRRYRGWIALAVLVLIGGAAYAVTRSAGAEETTTTYTTDTATVGTLSVTVSGTGNLAIDGTTDVWPTVAGTVASVEVAKDASVTTGTVLFTLDASDAEAATARALASYRQAQQQVTQAEQQVAKAEATYDELAERSEDPSASASVHDADLTAAKLEIESASAGLTSARAQASSAQLAYEQAKDAEDDLVVTSPCAGNVYSLDIEVGDSVSPGTSGGSGSSATATNSSSGASSSAPMVIAPEQPLAVRLTVNEVDIPSLAVGQRAEIEFDALPEVTSTGKVYEIASDGTNTQGVVTFEVWLTLDVANPSLRPGMSAAATIVTQIAKGALLVPNAAVKSASDGGYYVQVLDSDATEPRQVTVETGLSSSTQTQILSGLSEGDRVVTVTSDSNLAGEDDGPGGGMAFPGMGGGPRG